MDHRENPDVGFGEGSGDFGKNPGAVFHAETEIKFGSGLIDRLRASIEIVRRESDALARGLEERRGLGEVAQHGTGGGVLTRATPVKKSLSDHIALHGDRIEHTVHRGEDMGFGNEGRHHTHFDRTGFVGLDRGDELDAVAEFIGETDVRGRDFFDALDEDILRIDPKAVGERGEDDSLVGGIPAIDVQSGVGLGVAQFLGLGEDRCKIKSLASHARDDVVARAVENSVDGLEAVPNKGFAHGFDNGNATGHGGFVENRHALFSGEVENFPSMFGEQRFVPSHDHLPGSNGFFDEGQRNLDATHQLDDYLNRRIGKNFVGIVREKRGGRFDISGFSKIADGDFFDLEGGANALGEKGPVALEVFVNPGANGAETRESDADCLAH